MIRSRAISSAALVVWLAAAGCTSLREIPRQDYAARASHRAVRVETREGLVYEFDYAEFSGDTLTGYRSRTEAEGSLDQVTQLRLPFDELQSVSVRQVDWRRTGLVGGGTLAAALVVGLKVSQRGDNGSNTSGGGKGFDPNH